MHLIALDFANRKIPNIGAQFFRENIFIASQKTIFREAKAWWGNGESDINSSVVVFLSIIHKNADVGQRDFGEIWANFMWWELFWSECSSNNWRTASGGHRRELRSWHQQRGWNIQCVYCGHAAPHHLVINILWNKIYLWRKVNEQYFWRLWRR